MRHWGNMDNKSDHLRSEPQAMLGFILCFKIFFLMWTIFLEVFFEFVMVLFLYYVLAF